VIIIRWSLTDWKFVQTDRFAGVFDIGILLLHTLYYVSIVVVFYFKKLKQKQAD
jgi:hypothetical protein